MFGEQIAELQSVRDVLNLYPSRVYPIPEHKVSRGDMLSTPGVGRVASDV